DHPLEKVIGSSVFDFFLTRDRDRFEKLFEQGWLGGSRGEFVLQTSNKRFLPFSISMYVLNSSDPPALGVIITDLSAEKEIMAVKSQVAIQNEIITKKDEELQREKQTIEEAKRFRIALEGIPQIAWTSTPEGHVNYTNLFWHEYTALTFEQTQRGEWLSILHPDDTKSTIDHINNRLKTGERVNIECRLRRA